MFKAIKSKILVYSYNVISTAIKMEKNQSHAKTWMTLRNIEWNKKVPKHDTEHETE